MNFSSLWGTARIEYGGRRRADLGASGRACGYSLAGMAVAMPRQKAIAVARELTPSLE